MSYESGEIISYMQMCIEEETSLQRGMNYRIKPHYSLILMSTRPGAPYHDKVEDDGKLLIYEGHDTPNFQGKNNPKLIDQPMKNRGGTLTQNGMFFEAAMRHRVKAEIPELVRVYEKIRDGIWVYNGYFLLIDAWQENDGVRNVFKFKLQLTDNNQHENINDVELEHSRFIPTAVKLEVWKRDKGQCIRCGSNKNLHFDHIIPYSKGGTSLKSENIQLLCASHNLSKSAKIE